MSAVGADITFIGVGVAGCRVRACAAKASNRVGGRQSLSLQQAQMPLQHAPLSSISTNCFTVGADSAASCYLLRTGWGIPLRRRLTYEAVDNI